MTVKVDFTDIVQNGVDFDQNDVITALNDGVGVNIAELEQGYTEGTDNVVYGELSIDYTTADNKDSLVQKSWGLMDVVSADDGLTVENGEIRVTADGTVVLSDGETTISIVITGYQASVQKVLGDGATIEALGDTELPMGASASYEDLSEKADELAETYDLIPEQTEEEKKEIGFSAFDVAVTVPSNDYVAEGSFAVTVPHTFEVPENAKVTYELFHIHEVDGVMTAEPVENATVEDGKLSFVTDGFSEYVVRYTVDFEYTDPETGDRVFWRWPGEGSYKVSDIMAEIGVTGEISDVSLERTVDVGGSEKVLYLEEKEDGWYLTSDEAFKDTFKLNVTVDGKVYTILVTDSAPPTTNLNELLQSFSVEGATQNSDGTYTVKPGKNYKVNMTFAESDTTKQFSDNEWMTFTLPEGITLKNFDPTFSVSVNSLGKQYTITGNLLEANGNQIRVKFNTNDPNFNKLSEITTTKFEIHANVEFQHREYENPIHVENSGDYHVDSTPEVTIAKSGKLVNFDTGEVKYTLNLKSNGSNNGITVNDVISGTALSLNHDVKMYDSSRTQLNPTVTYDGNSFQLKTPALQDGNYTIEYTAHLDVSQLTPDQWNNGNLGTSSDTQNDVTWDGDKHTSTNLGHIVKKPSSSKGKNGDAVTDANGIATIPWKITAESNYKEDWRLRDVTDTIKSEGMWYSGNGIHIKIIDSTTNATVKEGDVAWNTIGITPGKEAGATTWTYDVNNFQNNENKLWKYEITYTTSYDASDLEQQTNVDNESTTNNDPTPHTGSSTVNPPESNRTNISKSRVEMDNQKIKWLIELSIPEKGLSAERSKVIEHLPAIPGKGYQDTYVPNSFAYVEGSEHVSADGVPEIDDTSVPGQVIFQWNGFASSENRRTIRFEFETYVDQNWLDDSSVDVNHKNDAEFNNAHAYADAVPVKPTFKKWGSSIRQQNNDYYIDYSIITNMITEEAFGQDGQGSLVFTDTFDERLEYVWGSARMYAGDDKDNIGYTTNDSLVSDVEVEGNVITFAIKRSELPGKSSYEGNNWIDTRELRKFYKLGYTLKVKDMPSLTEEALGKKNLTVTIGNSIHSVYGDDEFNVEYTPDVLNKWQNGVDSNGRLKFYIEVNKAKVDISSSTNEIILSDTLTNLSAHYQDIEIQVEDYDTPYMGIDGNGDPVQLPYFNMKGDNITFYLPDNHRVLITYYAKAVGEMSEDGNIHWRNAANLNGYEKIVENSVAYSGGASGSATNYGVRLYKVDGYVNSIGLTGAKFKLYMADVVDEEGNIISGTPMKDINGHDVIFETKANEDNDLAYGEVEIKGDANVTGWNLKPEQRYYLVEVEAPEGKAFTNTRYSFMISSNGYVNYSHRAIEAPDGSGAIIQPWTYYNGDILTVKNYPKKGVIRLKKILKDASGNTIDADDMDDDQKAAIKFVISKLNSTTGNYEVIRTIGFDEFNDETYLVADLDMGTYKVTESIAEGQYVTETVYNVTRSEDSTAPDLATIVISQTDVTDHTLHPVTITNTYDIPSEFKIYKYARYAQTMVGSELTDLKDIKLAGAEFGVFAVNGSTLGNQIGPNYRTNSRGRFSVIPGDTAHDLAYDTVYALKEVKAPEGYKLSEQVYYFCFLSNGTNSLPAGAPAGTIGIPYKKSASSDVPNEIGTTTVGAVKVWQNIYLEQDDTNNNSVPVKIKRITSYDKAGKVVEKTEYYPDIVLNLVKDGTTWKFEKANPENSLPTGVAIDSTSGRLTGLPTMTFSDSLIPLYYNYEVEEQPVKIAGENYVPTYSIARETDGSTTTTITNKPGSVTSSVILKAKKKWVDDAGNDVTADMGYNKSVIVDVFRKVGMLDVGTIIDNGTTVRNLPDQFALTVEGPAFATLDKNLMVCLPGDQIKVTIWPTEVTGSWTSSGSMPTVTPTSSNNTGSTNAPGEYLDNERYEYIFSADPVYYRTVINENSNQTSAIRVEVENLTAKNRVIRLTQSEAAVAGGELVDTLEISKATGWRAQSREFPAGSGTTPFTYYMVERNGTSYDAKYSIDDSTNTITVTNIDKKLKVDKKWFNAYGTEEIANPNGQIVYNLYQVANEATWSETFSGSGSINANITGLNRMTYSGTEPFSFEPENVIGIKEGSKVRIEISTDQAYNSPLTGEITVAHGKIVKDQYVVVNGGNTYITDNKDLTTGSVPNQYSGSQSNKRIIEIEDISTGFKVTGSVNGQAGINGASFTVIGEPGDPSTPSSEQLVQTKIGRVTMIKDDATVVFEPAFEDANIKVSPGATNWSSVITNLPEKGVGGITYTYYITEEAVEGFELMSIDTVPASAASTVVIKNKKEPSGNLTVKKVVSGATGQKSKVFKVTVTTVIHDSETDQDVTWYAREDGTLTTDYTELTVSQNQELLIEELPLGDYTVTEINGNGNANVQIDGYYFVSKTSDPADGSVTFTRENMDATVTLTNTYVKAVDVTKHWGDGVTPRGSDDPVYFALYQSAKGSTDSLTEVTDSEQDVSADTAWKASWTNLDFENHDYYVIEYIKVGGNKVYDGQTGWPYETLIKYGTTNLTAVAKDGKNFYHIGEFVEDSTSFKFSSLSATNNNPPTGSLKLTKLVSINGGTPFASAQAEPTPADGDYVFTIAGPSPATALIKYVQITVTNGVAVSYKIADTEAGLKNAESVNGAWAVVSDLKGGAYTIEEQASTNGTTLTDAKRGDDTSATSKTVPVVVTVVENENAPADASSAAAKFTNNKDTYGELDIEKAVTAGSVATGKTFTFEVTFTTFTIDGPKPYVGPVKVQDKTHPTATEAYPESNGKLTVQIEGAGTAHITDIPVGTHYEVVESALAGWKQEGTVMITGGDHDKIIAAGEKEIAKFTNSEVISIPVRKSWEADWPENVDSVTVQLRQEVNGAEVDVPGKTVTITSVNWFTGQNTFTDLPKFDENGQRIIYTVTETKVTLISGVELTENYLSDAYEISVGVSAEEGFTIHNVPKKDRFKVKKTWGDDQRPPEGAKIKIKLIRTNDTAGNFDSFLEEKGIPAEITLDGVEDNTYETTAWEYEWTNLPKYDDQGFRITYDATETSYKIGTDEMLGNEGILSLQPDYNKEDPILQLIVTNKLPKTSIDATKEWSEAPLSDSAKVTFQLFADDVAIPEAAGTTPGDEKYKVTIGENGKVIDLNTDPELDDGSASYIPIDWTLSWFNLPKYNNAGKAIVYTVREIGFEYDGVNYEVKKNTDGTYSVYTDGAVTYLWSVSVSEDGNTFTNKLEQTTFEADKTWLKYKDDGTTEELTPEAGTEIVLKVVQYKGQEAQTTEFPQITLNGVADDPDDPTTNEKAMEVEAWKAKWTELPKYYRDDSTGERAEYTYKVEEVSVKYGSATTASNVDGGITSDGMFIVQYDEEGDTVSNILNKKPVSFGKKWVNLSQTGIPWVTDNSSLVPIYVNLTRARGMTEKEHADNGESGETQTKFIETLMAGQQMVYSETEQTLTIGEGLNAKTCKVTWTNGTSDNNYVYMFTIDGLEKYANVNGEAKEWTYTLTESGMGSVDGRIFRESYKVNGKEHADEGEWIVNIEQGTYELPSTGGPGTTMFYIVGSILTILAGVLLITKKRTDGQGID